MKIKYRLVSFFIYNDNVISSNYFHPCRALRMFKKRRANKNQRSVIKGILFKIIKKITNE